jgi:hypothetical protein
MITLEALLFELVMPFLGAPFLGAIIGGLVGRRALRPWLAALIGSVGGAVGGCVGIKLYHVLILPEGPNLIWFIAFLLSGVRLGSSVLARRATQIASHEGGTAEHSRSRIPRNRAGDIPQKQ